MNDEHTQSGTTVNGGTRCRESVEQRARACVCVCDAEPVACLTWQQTAWIHSICMSGINIEAKTKSSPSPSMRGERTSSAPKIFVSVAMFGN